MPIIYPQNATAFYVESYSNAFNKFLDAIDGSYCLQSEKEGKRQCELILLCRWDDV